jgi:hypothetical protein
MKRKMQYCGDEACRVFVPQPTLIREFANVREKFGARGTKANGGGLFQRRRRGFAKVSVFCSSPGPVKFPFI